MPTMQELKTYSETLPDVYVGILRAFPAESPGRRAGDPLAISTIVMNLNDRAESHSDDVYNYEEVEEACRQLAENGFLTINQKILAQPTELGEQLIGVLTGQTAPKRGVPALPKPTW